MIATVVNVFCLLFAVILALIAMANVFNTVTNSLILRRREFAVMKSVGLSNRQFRAMVAEECVAWCIRGLVPGVLAVLVILFQPEIRRAMERFGGNAELYERLALKFLDDTHFAALEQALAGGDVDTAVREAHTLKGVAGNRFVAALYEAASKVNAALREGDLAGRRRSWIPSAARTRPSSPL